MCRNVALITGAIVRCWYGRLSCAGKRIGYEEVNNDHRSFDCIAQRCCEKSSIKDRFVGYTQRTNGLQLQSATINSPGTIGRVRGRAPRYAARPISNNAPAKIASFPALAVRVCGSVFQKTSSTICATTTAQTEP